MTSSHEILLFQRHLFSYFFTTGTYIVKKGSYPLKTKHDMLMTGAWLVDKESKGSCRRQGAAVGLGDIGESEWIPVSR